MRTDTAVLSRHRNAEIGPRHWMVHKMKYAVRRVSPGSAEIKGNVSLEPGDGLVPGYSASGQDVWLPANGAQFAGPGIVVSAVGARCGKAFRADGRWGVVANTQVLLPRPGYDRDYLWWVLNNEDFWEKGGTAQPYVRFPESLARSWAFPPLDEQRAIADFLDEKTAAIDALIAKKERLIELIEERLQATITRAVTKGLDSSVPTKHSGVEWLGDVPVHWVMKRLKYVVSHVTSGSRGWAEFYSETGAVFLRIGNLRRGSIRLDLSDVQRVAPPLSAEGERTRIQQGDVLFSITAFIGAVAVVYEDLGVAYVNQHIALVRPKWDLVDPSWIGYSFLSEHGQRSLKYPVYGGTKEGLGLDDIKNLTLPCPPLDEQRTIVRMLEVETGRHHELVEKTRHQIDRLREYRQALISAAVTGQIDVRREIEVPA